MSTPVTAPPPLHADEQSVAQYKSISWIALLALGFGVASSLVLVSPLLAPLGVLAIVVAVVGLRGIGASGGQLVGRLPAIVGICLATFFLGWCVTATFSRQIALENFARRFTDAWLTLVAQGDLQQAHQMRISAHARMRSPEAIAQFYRQNPDAAESMKSFFAVQPLKDFIAAGKSVSFQFDSIAGAERSGDADVLVLKYTFDDANPASPPRPLWVTVERALPDGESQSEWRVEAVVGEPLRK